MTFANTIIMEAIKLVSPDSMPKIHEHPHPHNALLACPFSIINGKYVQDKR